MSDLNSLLEQSSYLRLMADNSKNKERVTSTAMSTQKEYVSCIRIKGRPILPPVMTPERRLECIEWKRKALEVEERLGSKRRETILATIRSLKITTSSASTDINSRPTSAPLTVEDFGNVSTDPPGYIDMNELNRPVTEEKDALETSAINAPSINNAIPETSNLYTDYKSNPGDINSIKEANNVDNEYHTNSEDMNDKTNEVCEKISDENRKDDNQNSVDTKELIVSNKDVKVKTNEESDSIHKRERRGSYTLDEPSPLLLAYMERFGQNFNEKNNSTKSK